MSLTSRTPEPQAGQAHSNGDLVSAERAAELDRQAEQERMDAFIAARDANAKHGVVPNLLARFSLIPSRGIDQDARDWQRKNDYARITITAGMVYDPKTDLMVPGKIPSGGLANLSLLWAVNQVRDNLRRQVDEPERIDLGPTLAGFLRSVGVAKGGKQYQQAMRALRSVFEASIQLHAVSEEIVDGVTGVRHRMIRADVASSYDLWDSDGNELPEFEPFAVASPALLTLAADAKAVPVRMDLLARLADSVLAQQALNWLAFNVYRLDMAGDAALEFSWDELFRNITHNTSNEKQFRRDWKKAVTRAVELWPEARDYLDLAAVPSVGSQVRRVIRLRRGVRPLVARKEVGA